MNSDRGYGRGDGDGYGRGDGDGYGRGDGRGDGDGYGRGYGRGDGDGRCDGDVRGRGYGRGDNDGRGDGDGYGRGYGLISFNCQKVYYIDGIPVVIERVHGNLAKGYTVNKDLTTQKCYIVKHNNLFAHGETAREAERALQDKIFGNMNADEKIDAFLEEFDLEAKYPARLFYEWHHKLTGSCEFGRKAFVKNHGIDLEKGTYTVAEFIEITKEDYGGDIIEQLSERIEEEKQKNENTCNG